MYFRFPDQTISVNIRDSAALLRAMRERFKAHQGFALATINLDHLVKLQTSTAFRKAYGKQDFVVADGNPIVWLSHLARHPVSLVTGSDTLYPVLALAAEEKVPVGLFGSSPEVLAGAAERLSSEIAGLTIVTTISPAMGFDPTGAEAVSALRQLQRSGVRLCILSLSPPRQEIFAALGRSLAPEIGFCSFGAGLDFVVGRQVRAPVWVRSVAMEWLWRALSSPRRLLPRYAACAAILPKLTLTALLQRNK